MDNNDTIFSDLEPTEEPTSYWQRILSSIIDWVIEIVLLIAVYLLLPQEVFYNIINGSSYGAYIIIIGLMFTYRLTCLLLLSKTIGMLLCKIKYLNGQLQPLSVKEKLMAVFVGRTGTIRYYKAN